MDKEQVKEYAWYVALGYVGALLSAAIPSINMWRWEFALYGWSRQLVQPAFLYGLIVMIASLLFGTPAGLIGGILIKKRWGAVLGGFIPNLIFVWIIVENWYRIG